MSEKACGYMPELKQWLRWDVMLIIRVAHAVYGLIQSPKLWYKELSGFCRDKVLKYAPRMIIFCRRRPRMEITLC
jgi:hypothetical protein